jgi:hypothetical protein
MYNSVYIFKAPKKLIPLHLNTTIQCFSLDSNKVKQDVVTILYK